MTVEQKNASCARHALLPLLIALCSACAERKPPDDGLENISDAVVSARVLAAKQEPVALDTPPSSYENRFAVFSVEPGHVSACKGKERTVSKVAWTIKDPSITGIKIMLDTEIEPEKKLFAMGGATGASDTGDWVGAGVRFYLVDAATDKELAKHVVTMLPCLD